LNVQTPALGPGEKKEDQGVGRRVWCKPREKRGEEVNKKKEKTHLRGWGGIAPGKANLRREKRE